MVISYTLDSEWETYLNQKVSSGDFLNTSEVIQFALCLLKDKDLKDDLGQRLNKMKENEKQYTTLEDFNNDLAKFLLDEEVDDEL